MKAALTIATLATSAMAANLRRGGDWGGDHGKYTTIAQYTTVPLTYYTTCPVTETKTKEGSTYYETYTTTSLCTTEVPTTVYVTQTQPDVTKTAETVVYATSTSLCPITETKTVGGKVETVTWTSTSIVVEKAPTTIPVYVTSVTTEYETVDTYVTTTCPVSTYTTIVKGETVCITTTDTFYVTHSTAYTVTEVIPVTQTKQVDITIATTLEQPATVTEYPTYWTYISGIKYSTVSPPPATITKPTYATSSSAPIVTSSPVPVTAAANANNAPAAALFAGALGFLALF
jgi:hypothetical protein